MVTILKKIRPSTFNQFKTNPEEFIIKTSNIINECKAIAVIEHVKYHKLDKQFESDIFSNTMLKGKLGVNALESQKSLYDLVVVDSAGIEMNFAKDLEERNEVAVYTKLPGGFYINTPVGHYNPDWAIVFKEGPDIKHVYFVAETKGSLEESQLRESERSKIECLPKQPIGILVEYHLAQRYEVGLFRKIILHPRQTLREHLRSDVWIVGTVEQVVGRGDSEQHANDLGRV